jgi:hypothetical protein
VSSPGRPNGFVEFVFEHGKIDCGFVLLDDHTQSELIRQFLPIKFAIAQLKADAKLLPKGFHNFLLERGNIKGDFVELDLDAFDELHEKFPVPVIALPKEPSLTEMTVNFTQALAGWAKAGFKIVNRETFEMRHTLCQVCEYWLPDARLGLGKCKKCGCSRSKLWMASTSCPLSPAKW